MLRYLDGNYVAVSHTYYVHVSICMPGCMYFSLLCISKRMNELLNKAVQHKGILTGQQFRVIPTAKTGGSMILSFNDVWSGLLSMQIQHESIDRNVANRKKGTKATN